MSKRLALTLYLALTAVAALAWLADRLMPLFTPDSWAVAK